MLLNFLLMNMYDFPSTNCLNLIVRLLTLLKMLDLMLLKMRATYGHTVSAPTVTLTVKSAPLSTPKGRRCRHLHTLADGALPESAHCWPLGSHLLPSEILLSSLLCHALEKQNSATSTINYKKILSFFSNSDLSQLSQNEFNYFTPNHSLK